MKMVDCYNCGSEQSNFYAEENGFSLVKCSGCGLLYVKNRPDDDKIMDDTKRSIIQGEKDLDVTVRFNKDAIPRYKIVLNDLFGGDFGKIKTWLDVGCGHGEFIETVMTVSSGAIAIKGAEPNVKKQESARKRGLDISYFDLATHKEKYDIVSLLDVYSHLPDPVLFIKSLKNLLNPGGEILIETGDSANFSAKEQVRPYCLPDHLSFASESIVVNILERLNFEILSIKKYPYLHLDTKSIVKEIVKLVLPNYNSSIKHYFNWKKHSQTNMFIRARLKI